jgi:hypothetical protein
MNQAVLTVKPLPPRAVALYARLSPMLSPSASAWIQSESKAIAGRNLAPDGLLLAAKNDVLSRFIGQGLSDSGVESLVTMVMMMAASDAQNDLRDMLAQVKAANAGKQAPRNRVDSLKNRQKDALGDFTEEQQLRLQVAMDRISKLEQTLSNVLAKISDTASGITQNLK